jgi:hypothetical protein
MKGTNRGSLNRLFFSLAAFFAIIIIYFVLLAAVK